MADQRLRELERKALSDPYARIQLNRARQRIGETKFILFHGVSRRTRQRWINHAIGRCGSKCRFCRREI